MSMAPSNDVAPKNVRLVSLNGLRERLRSLLGSDSLLFERFDIAIREQDEDLIQTAMDCLSLYPEEVRRQVHDTMLAWLFDGSDTSGLIDVPAASEARH